jgi:hypothetical protein
MIGLLGARRVALGALVVVGLCRVPLKATLLQWTAADSDAENQAIGYSTTEPKDAVARLQRAIDAGTKTLQFDIRHGYLLSLLRELQISVSSQSLVFSRTSFQRERISPARPRALYFNRDAYVGWVPDGRALEIASVDPTLGPVFYTLAQEETTHPRFQRHTRACLQCHDSPSLTGGVPGLIVKSVHTDKDGEPIVVAGAKVTNDRSLVRERWGGWYVTGWHGEQLHMGVDLGPNVDTAPYPSAHSDIATLTVLAHQTSVQNLLTHVGYRTRMALHFERQRNWDLGVDVEHVADTTQRLLASVAEPLVRAMLFVDERSLGELASGAFGFQEAFAQQAPRDRRGRSLYDLDLTRRLLRYPCSYLIYSPAFDALPAPAKQYVYRRLWEVLSGKDTTQPFALLTHADRTAVLEILLDTKPEFVSYAQ